MDKPCGCRIKAATYPIAYEIVHCPLHASAGEMLKRLKMAKELCDKEGYPNFAKDLAQTISHAESADTSDAKGKETL